MDKDLSRFHPHLPERFGDSLKENAAAEPQILLPTPNELVALLSSRVIGHEQAKRTIAVAVYQHLMQCAHVERKGAGRVEAENHVMLVGPTGSGKSLLLQTLASVLGGINGQSTKKNIPVFTLSCNRIVPHGYKGKDISEYLRSIANRIVDGAFTHPAIIVWDEVDKLSIYDGPDKQESAASIYRRMTQTDLLTFFGGTMCEYGENMDPSRILNIACGAFVGMDEIRKPKNTPVIGYHANDSADDAPELMIPLKPEHLVEFGLIPEFVGRFSRLANLEPFDRCVMRRILLEAEGNALARRKEFFQLHGIRLEITDDAIDEIIVRTMSHCTGARALRVVIDQVLGEVEHRLPEMQAEGVNALVIDRDTVDGKKSPIEQKGEVNQNTCLLDLRRAAAFTDRLKLQADIDDDELSCF